MKILAFFGTLLIGALIGLFIVYVIRDIAQLFALPFIADLTFAQVYGFYILGNLARFKLSRKDLDSDDKDESTRVAEGIVFSVLLVVSVLFFWGMAYVMHLIVS